MDSFLCQVKTTFVQCLVPSQAAEVELKQQQSWLQGDSCSFPVGFKAKNNLLGLFFSPSSIFSPHCF